MRFKQFKPRTLTEAELQQLDELRMNPTTLQQFAGSDDAKGIMAGFEAELVFTGLGGEPEYDEDPEPDMDADERCRSIQQVMDFFENDEYGYGVYGREADKLQEGLDEMYYEWHDEQMFQQWKDERDDIIRDRWLEEKPWDERIHAALVDGLDMSDEEADAIQELHSRRESGEIKGSEMSEEQLDMVLQYSEAKSLAEDILNDDVEQTIDKQDGFYDEALDEFRDGFYIDDDSGFFDDVGLRWMSDVRDQFDLMWPVMTYTGSSSEGGFSVDNAERLADDLHEKLGVKTKVSSGYHSARRDAVTWIFEPDSSLDADDSDNMPVEIVSPPMPLLDCLDKMQQFFEWAESNGAYSNSSTGFHMGVSLPHRGGNVDYVKLALFLGDEHVLREFGRSGNHFCEAAMKKIRNRVKGNKEAVAGALELMKHNLIELAQKALEINNHGFGKYTSINPQGGNDSTHPHKERGAKYIEFRSAGGTNYFEDIDKLKNTLLRYAQAMTIAANPAAERREYYKKLYKLISPPEGDPAIDLFSRFATGEISSTDLKKAWAEKQLEKEPTGSWVLYDSNGKRVQDHTYNGYTKTEAWEKAKKKLSPGSSMEDFKKAYKLLPSDSPTGDWEVYNTNTGETLEVLRGYESRGRAADAVYDKYADQKIPFNLRPVDPNEPEPELTKRERLAKNIKAAPPEEVKNWKVYDTKTGEVHYEQEGRKSNLVQAMRKMERDNKWPQGRLAIEEIPANEPNYEVVSKESGKVVNKLFGNTFSEVVDKLNAWADSEGIERRMLELRKIKTPQQDTTDSDDGTKTWEVRFGPAKAIVTADSEEEAKRQAAEVNNDIRGALSNNFDRQHVTAREVNSDNVPRKWEFYYAPTGRVLDQVTDATTMQARAVLADTQRRYNDLDADQIRMRTVPTDASQARYNDRQELNPVIDQPPEGLTTQRPSTGDYYEVRSGDRVYGYLSVSAAHAPGGMGPARAAREYVNNLTGRSDAQLVYKAGDPVQATAPNGVPMWQVYERDSGNVVHEFADHDQASAWVQGRAWLGSIGAEDPSLFSVRPKMES